MSRQIVVKGRFRKAYKRLSEPEQHLVNLALKCFELYLQTQQASPGLGIKHLGRHTYEFRAGLALRIVYILEENQVILALLGTHDEVRRYLKHS